MEQAVRKGDFYFMSLLENQGYTIADIEALPEGQRAELFDGEMIMMASPTITHQAILNWINLEIYSQIKAKGGKCRVFPAPVAVFILDDDKNYVEPDLIVICDRDKLDNKGCHGAPDFVVEIVSPSSKKLDYYRKLEVYQRAGVREYWIVDAFKKTIVVHSLEQDEIPTIYHFTDAIKVGICDDVVIDFSRMTDYDFEN